MERIALAPLGPAGTPRLRWGDLPLEFWRLVLGSGLHVGTASWPRWAKSADRAEAEWCRLVAERLRLAPGQRLLEIGASPGVLARWAEANMPGLEVTLLASNPESHDLLEQAVAQLGPQTASVADAGGYDFSPARKFDRILLIEGLSRFANPGPTLDRVLSWLTGEGLLLVQIACHWRDSYEFEPGDEHGWMLPEVPDGALLPGQQYLDDLIGAHRLHSRWELSGEHYQRTARAWLRRLDGNRERLLAVLAAHGVPHPRRTLRAWRQALLALELMYGFREGQEWCTTQLLLESDRG